jgi:hypothetical protein
LNYPHYQAWLDILARRDFSLLMIGVCTALVVVWLCMARFWWPQWLARLRIGLIAGFFVTLAIMIGVTK